MPGKTIVVLGGGTGGLVAAHRLAREQNGHRIVLVERSPVYSFAPSFLWVMNGTRRPEQVTVDLHRLTRRGVELVQAEVGAIDVGARRVETSTGSIPYDRLVIALGAELAPDLLPGFAEAAHTVYTSRAPSTLGVRSQASRAAPRRPHLAPSLQVPGRALRDGSARRRATPQARRPLPRQH